MFFKDNNFFLILEFLALCIGLPTIIIYYRLAPYMFFFLWGAALYCWLIYRYCGYFQDFKTMWGFNAVTLKNLKPIIQRWIICCLFMTGFVYLYDPEKLFYMAMEKPRLLMTIFIAYPLLSALPQEFIFCTFFFARYKPLFKTRLARIINSAIVFAYAHVLFINIVAPVLSFIAGLIFARTYANKRSLALVTIEHGLYGNYLFMVGLGWYFWGGAVALSQ